MAKFEGFLERECVRSCKCNDCGIELTRGDTLWWDNNRKSDKGKGVRLCCACKHKAEESAPSAPGAEEQSKPSADKRDVYFSWLNEADERIYYFDDNLPMKRRLTELLRGIEIGILAGLTPTCAANAFIRLYTSGESVKLPEIKLPEPESLPDPIADTFFDTGEIPF